MTPEDFKNRMVEEGGCWRWLGPFEKGGYGKLGRHLAHRVAYEMYVGPITDGLTVDHVCFNSACVNPAHLRLLTRSENASRQRKALSSFCMKGHEFTPENTYIKPAKSTGKRQCRTCMRDAKRRYKERVAAA